MNEHTHPNLEPELQRVSDGLDALAAGERAAPDAGFEARVAEASAGALRGVAGTIRHRAATGPGTPRRRWAMPRVALAASLGLVATLGAAFLAQRSVRPAPGPALSATDQAALADLIAIGELLDERSLLGVSALRTEVDAVMQRVGTGWSASDLDLDEGAM
jgi:hypothetical protein